MCTIEDTRLKINFGLARGMVPGLWWISYVMGKYSETSSYNLNKILYCPFVSLFLWILFFRYEPTKKDTKVQIKKPASVFLKI